MTEPVKRVIPATFDNRGNPSWHSRMSPPDNSVAVCNMVPDRIIPVVFVPGVMGSNLRQRKADPDKAVRWRLDSKGSAGAWALATRNARFRKEYLNPTVMEVDPEGKVSDQTKLPAEELRRRGWGEVGFLSYGEFLAWLENTLNDYDHCRGGLRETLIGQVLGATKGEAAVSRDEVALSYRYRFAVYACGYNWLDSNAVAAQRLKARIEQTVARYRAEKKRCEKVIVVTHSMGGLVARHCSEVLGMRERILGIVHGVMPAIGAAAVYRRFKAGTEDPTAWYNVGGAAAASALGNDAAEMTAVLSSAPGPLQLLPTPEYGNGWLCIKDGKTTFTLPQKGDPYGEIYAVRGKWWSMCEDHLINPLNDERDAKKRKAVMDADWKAFDDLIKNKVQPFHLDLIGRYHPNTYAFFGSHTDQRAYGTVTWKGDGGSWLRGQRKADVLNARALDPSQINEDRTVAAQLEGSGWANAEQQNYEISEPDEPGDGTVPHRSGIAPREHVKSLLQVNTGHEPAYYAGADLERVRRFTVRSIVKIAQGVTQTSLAYE